LRETLRGAIADTPHVAQFQHPSLTTDDNGSKKSMKLIHGEVTGKLHETQHLLIQFKMQLSCRDCSVSGMQLACLQFNYFVKDSRLASTFVSYRNI
jgi:hypothetical protein